MAQKCVHKGCGKVFTDPEEPCIYHPGPPEFHEGQKGWKCCKPRFLTFDEFLAIPPCTTGKHSTVDDTPVPEPKPVPADIIPAAPKPVSAAQSNGLLSQDPGRKPISTAQAIAPSSSPAPPESESDDPDTAIPKNASCRRKGCKASHNPDTARDDEECVHHPGIPIFHEGSKGWTCCKRRVLEFDEFMKIPGCKTKKRHLYVGKPSTGEEKLDNVRNDFYQTPTTVIVSIYLKKIDKEKAKVEFSTTALDLDLPTSDNKRYTTTIPLFGPIDTAASKFKIMGTKLELQLVKTDGASWPVLRSDERLTGERIQVGRAGRV